MGRPEAARTGVYILAGPDPEQPGGISVYIGETDNIAKRLPIHLRSEDRDFFERVAVVVAKDDLLTKNHARFIESQLIQIATDAGHVSLENTTLPNFTLLPEADKTDMTYFVRQLRLVLPLLGFGLFRQPVPTHVTEDQTLFTMSAAGATATARETDEGFIVLSGSTARMGGTETFPAGYRALRDQLVEDGRLVTVSGSGVYRFAQEVAFASPSAAAAVIAGRSASGPLEWEVEGSRQLYCDWRARLLGAN